MIFYFLSVLACDEPDSPATIYYTSLPEDTGNTTDSGDTGDTETGDTDDTEIEAQKLAFKTTNISCENLVYYDLSFTQFVPGGLEIDDGGDEDLTNDLLAEFEYEIWRYEFEDFEEVRIIRRSDN